MPSYHLAGDTWIMWVVFIPLFAFLFAGVGIFWFRERRNWRAVASRMGLQASIEPIPFHPERRMWGTYRGTQVSVLRQSGPRGGAQRTRLEAVIGPNWPAAATLDRRTLGVATGKPFRAPTASPGAEAAARAENAGVLFMREHPRVQVGLEVLFHRLPDAVVQGDRVVWTHVEKAQPRPIDIAARMDVLAEAAVALRKAIEAEPKPPA